jgi:hypothetical protein
MERELNGKKFYRPMKPLADYLNELHSSYRATALRKVRIVLELSQEPMAEGIPSLETALAMLGRAHARLAMLEEIQELLTFHSGSMLAQWPRELWDLREESKKSLELCGKIIKAICYEELKANSEEQCLKKSC